MKTLICGLDLSFSSTGITFVDVNESVAKSISFWRLIFDPDTNIYKDFVPNPIQNVNDVTYKMPQFLLPEDFIIDSKDKNNKEQIEATLKAMSCAKHIKQIIDQNFNIDDYDFIVFCIENYIMPAFSGKNQLKTVSGLITLQGFVRSYIISEYGNAKKVKMLTPTPSSVKSFFAGNGKADKEQMKQSFITNYEGNKLIPTIEDVSIVSCSDIIDSFALSIFAYHKIINNTLSKNILII